MRKQVLALVTLALSLLAPRVEAATLCLTIQRGALGDAADALLNSGSPNKGYGASGSLAVGAFSGAERRSLLAFDLSVLPAGIAIVSAIATLDVVVSSGGAKPVRAHQALSPWSEGAVTWNNFGGAFASSVAATFPVGASSSADITALASGWYDGSIANHGVLLERDLDGGTVFASSEGAGAQRPRLDVCFQPVPCSPGCDAETQFCYFGSCYDRVPLGEGCGYLAADPDSSCLSGWCSACSGECESLPRDCGCSLAPVCGAL